jgi:hypothetical protein
MSDAKISAVSKPSKPYDHRAVGPAGHKLDVHGDGNMVGAWLGLDGSPNDPQGVSLGVISVRQGGEAQNYVQYRDGKANMPRLVIAVDDAGVVTLQALVHGESNELSRVRTIVGIDNILALFDE